MSMPCSVNGKCGGCECMGQDRLLFAECKAGESRAGTTLHKEVRITRQQPSGAHQADVGGFHFVLLRLRVVRDQVAALLAAHALCFVKRGWLSVEAHPHATGCGDTVRLIPGSVCRTQCWSMSKASAGAHRLPDHMCCCLAVTGDELVLHSCQCSAHFCRSLSTLDQPRTGLQQGSRSPDHSLYAVSIHHRCAGQQRCMPIAKGCCSGHRLWGLQVCSHLILHMMMNLFWHWELDHPATLMDICVKLPAPHSSGGPPLGMNGSVFPPG